MHNKGGFLMRGVILLGEGEVELREFPEPIPGPSEVIVDMRASGLCGSDLGRYRRRADFRG